MIDVQKNRKDDHIMIKISGDATINFIGELKNEFLKFLDEKNIIFDLAGITECDLSFIQLLISLNNHLIKNKGKIKILKEKLSEKFTTRFKTCGFDRHDIF